MALPLVPGALDECSGIARCLPAFDPTPESDD